MLSRLEAFLNDAILSNFLKTVCGAILATALLPSLLNAKQENELAKFSDQELDFFETKVRPLLVEKCFDCHGPDSEPIEGGLSLGSRANILTGGDTGPAIVVGHAAQSLMIDAINYGEVYEMPPDTKMSDDEIAIITKWVNSGAAWPTEPGVATVDPKKAFDLEGRKSEHWCWQPVKNPKTPAVKNEQWPRDAIDNFILEKLENANLEPAKPADRRTLIRRAYFDLIGLPPSAEQVEAFVVDADKNAFEKVVDRLLADPAFGERWARHWMDLTRYAETYGHEFDYPIHHAYQYRDYLIRAFNDDVSYDDLIQEHIAGDLIKKPRLNDKKKYNESILGSGFWFLDEATHGPVDVRGDEAGHIDNRIDVMTKSFLGLTVACARCHDHKFDAISTEDYYALAGFLQSSRQQLAMLDPNLEIQQAHQAASKLVQQGDKVSRELVNRLKTADNETVSKYMLAALEFLRVDKSWNNRDAFHFEGEGLQEIEITGGETRIQELKPQDGLTWSKHKQFWWLDAKKDDQLKLEFELNNVQGKQEYELEIEFTKAPDYGAFNISLDGKRLSSNYDLYATKLSKSGPTVVGKVILEQGKHALEFKVSGHHDDAIARHMLGIDWIKLKPVVETDNQLLASIAERHSANLDITQKLIDAIKADSDPRSSPRELTNSIGVLKAASKSRQPIDLAFANKISSDVSAGQTAAKKWNSESTQFANFKDGLPEGWFQTGFAFSHESKSQLFSGAGHQLRAADSFSSGVNGSRFYGVLRSPTFTLETDKIFYRLRGQNASVRLIVDGYVMDVYNALLFKGLNKKIDEVPNFQWITQTQDLNHYIGHRAHIEIIDHGDGFIDVDQIRFSESNLPRNYSDSEFAFQGKQNENEKYGLSEFVNQLAAGFTSELADDLNTDRELASWILKHDLVEVFCAKNENVSTRNRISKETAYVSVNSNDSRIDNDSSTDNENLLNKLASIRERLEKLNEETPRPMFGIAMADGTGEEEKIFIRGNHKTLGAVATRRFLSAISGRSLNPADGSGRLKLAQKITARNNPLTSRVAINRIWHHLMGGGIVESVDNFGVLGKTPTHPELLDHLATSLVKDDWSVKRMIRRIVLTSTYQMASKPNEAAATIDPNNQLLHRARIKRLQGEAIRDSMLQISGELDKTMFGPSVPIHLTEFMKGRGRPRKSGPLNGNGRRSIYVSINRNFLSPMMLAFDTPIPFNTAGKRNQSNVPAQALILMNDPFVIEQPKKWAEVLSRRQDDSIEERITLSYNEALGRPPTDSELSRSKDFIETQAAERNIEPGQILTHVELWQDFCHVLFNVKEFAFIK